MDDIKIVELFWERSETAISESEKKYGRYCRKIAINILGSSLDSEECVNDTWLKAWNSIPPSRPKSLAAFLGRITRNTAINRYNSDRAAKRNAHVELILDEAGEMIPDTSGSSLSDELTLKLALNEFMETLSTVSRVVFVRRYWYMDSVSRIARDVNLSENNVKVMLSRTRSKFKAYLEEKGIIL